MAVGVVKPLMIVEHSRSCVESRRSIVDIYRLLEQRRAHRGRAAHGRALEREDHWPIHIHDRAVAAEPLEQLRHLRFRRRRCLEVEPCAPLFDAGHRRRFASTPSRKSAGLAAGGELDVDVEFDTEPREVAMPARLAICAQR